MKRPAPALALAVALALGVTAALAQAPAAAVAPQIPAARCEPKPVYPGMKALADDRKRETFQMELKNFQDCVKAYVAERKAFVEATNAAIRATVEEHNAVMNAIREQQDAAKKELEGK